MTQNLIWELMSPKSRASHVNLEPQSQEWWLLDLSSDINEPPASEWPGVLRTYKCYSLWTWDEVWGSAMYWLCDVG